MALIWRWERPGLLSAGVYDGAWLRERGIDAYDSAAHPSPWDDFGAHVSELAPVLGASLDDTRFGFTSPAMMEEWFDEEMQDDMRAHGAYCVIYDVPREAVIEAERQAVFDHSRATRVGEYA